MFSFSPYSHLSVKYYIESEKAKSKFFKHLDLSRFNGKIELGLVGTIISQSELVVALQNCGSLESVDLSGHREMDNLTFSRFRKHLPNLKEIHLYHIKPQDFAIDAKQLAKYYANHIQIKADDALLSHIHSLVCAYLQMNGEENYAYELAKTSLANVDADKIKKAFTFEDEKREEEAKKRQEEFERTAQMQDAARDKLMQCYKNGEGFDTDSVWYKEGPTDPNDFEFSGLPTHAYVLYLVITQLNLWSVVKKGPAGNGGFMFTSPKELDAVYNDPAVQSGGHTGMSMGFCMRIMEQIALKGSFLKFKMDLAEQKLKAKM